jgi:hypothetical protein
MGESLLTAAIFNPLGIKELNGVIAIRHPTFGNNDLSMNIGTNVQKNTAVIQMHTTPESIVEANPNTIKELNVLMEKEAKSYFLISSGGCRLGLELEGGEKKIYPTIKKVAGDKEFLMIFTYGEYGSRDHSSNIVGNLSLSFTGFGK